MPEAVSYRDCTIAIPVYNRISFLSQVIASAMPLVVKGARLIVIDDCSKEEVWEQLRSHLPKQAQLIRNPQNKGLFGNWQECLMHSETPYTLILCSDDLCCPEFVVDAMAILKRNPDAAFVSSRGKVVDARGQHLGVIGDAFPAGLYDGPRDLGTFLDFYGKTGVNPFNYPSGILLNTSLGKGVNGFDVTMRHIGDLDLYFRLMTKHTFALVEQVGAVITFHDSQAGVVQAKEPIGMRELQMLDDKLEHTGVLVDKMSAIRKQHLALALFHSLKILLKGDTASFSRYVAFVRQSPYFGLSVVARIGLIFVGKLQLKMSPAAHRWMRASHIRPL